MQKAGESENDAGFLKHNYSQLNCSCYSYPSKPRLQWLQFFRLHIYGISKRLLTQLTHTHTATARLFLHVTCTSNDIIVQLCDEQSSCDELMEFKQIQTRAQPEESLKHNHSCIVAQ